MQDHLIWPSINDIYQSSKNITWRKQVLESSIVIFRFLHENNLLLVNPFDENGNVLIDLSLMRSDVTDIGDEMFSKTIPNWQKARDRDGNLKNLSILENGLKNIKESRQARG